MIIIRYDEIWLKGQNQAYFIQALKKSIQLFFVKYGHPKPEIYTPNGRLIVDTELEPPWIKDVFGISSYSFARCVSYDMDTISTEALSLYSKVGTSPFRVSCQRLDKTFHIQSQEVERIIGGLIVETTGHSVDLIKFSSDLCIELIYGRAYVFCGRTLCHGGYPVGTQGKALLLVETPDDLLAGVLMMKRGCNILVHNIAGLDLACLSRYHATIPGVLLDVNPESIAKFGLLACVNTTRASYLGLVVFNPLVGFTPSELKSLQATFLDQ